MRKALPQPKKGSRPRTDALAAPQARSFRNRVYAHFRARERSFPWRKSRDPYRILVSEIMLQQTQADRVVQKYRSFLKTFPTVHRLAAAPLAAVLKVWQGLGYNRRAKLLREAAQTIVHEYSGRVPRDIDALKKLPGVGPYTAAAVMVFAFNKPEVMIETNIRSVYLHHFFSGKKGIHDHKLAPLIGQTLDRTNPRKWYASLMDYGAHLKKIHPNPSRRSRHHVKQSQFAGSNRQIRGSIIRLLLQKRGQTERELSYALCVDRTALQKNLEQMRKEGLLKKQKSKFVVG